MSRVMVAIALCAGLGCKPHDPAPASAGSATGAGPAVPAGSAAHAGSAGAGSAGAGPAGAGPGAAMPAGVLEFETPDPNDDGSSDLYAAVDVAFGGKHPRLPAVSADGKLFADYDSAAGEPMLPVAPMDVVLRTIDSSDVAATLAIVEMNEADAANGAGSGWKTPALIKTLTTRGATALARLRGFRSLARLELPTQSGGDREATTIDGLTFDPDAIELRDAHGHTLQRADLPGFSTSDATCGYDVWLRDVFRDPAARMLYVEASYRYRDDCDPPPVYVLAWSLDPGKADPAAWTHGMIVHQFDAVPSVPVTINRSTVADLAARAKAAVEPATAVVTMSRDGNAAWGSVIAGEVARASDVLVKTPAGWQLAAAAWTTPIENAAANADARAHKLAPRTLDGGPGDPALAAAFAKLTTDGVDAAAARRDDLVAIGSGPGERTVGGARFARAWNAAWKGKVTIHSAVARTTPSGTTGWVAATVELHKPGYALPFTVFAVFDKASDGAWSLVHIHFAV